MREIKFLDLKAQYHAIKGEIDQAISRIIESGSFIGGSELLSFEKAFGEYQEAMHCIGVGNGTDALEIALEGLGLPKGSEVIVPANTFIATSEAVTRSGLKVVFCDCNPENYTISVEDFRRSITSRTSAVIAVHLYGHPCDMDSIVEIAAGSSLRVIEDAAQAHGARYKGRRVGTMGDVGTFSFYPGKNLGAYGDGGCIVTNDGELAAKCRMIANHGRVEKYNHKFEGRNSRLDNIQAAVLNVKLKYLDKWIETRKHAAQVYHDGFANLKELTLPVVEPWAEHVFHLFVVRTAERDTLKEHLKENGIATGIHYPVDLPSLEAYSHIEQTNEDMSAKRICKEILSLPMGDHLSKDDCRYTVECIKRFFVGN